MLYAIIRLNHILIFKFDIGQPFCLCLYSLSVNRNLKDVSFSCQNELQKIGAFGVFNNPLKYISFYETTWKLTFMVHQNVIEI